LLPTLPSEEGKDTPQNSKQRRLVASSRDRELRRQKLSVLLTMKKIAAEGNGGVQNLFAGRLAGTDGVPGAGQGLARPAASDRLPRHSGRAAAKIIRL